MLGVSSLLLADDHDGAAVIFGESGDHRGVVAVGAIAVEFAEVLKEQADVIHQVGALGMASEQGALPGAEVLVKFVAQLSDFGAQAFDVGGGNFRAGEALQVFDLAAEFFDFVFWRVSLHMPQYSGTGCSLCGV